jgi:hypothetical protein
MSTKFCMWSNTVWAGSQKPGRAREVIKCRCGKMVKLRIPPNGDRSYYVQTPRHREPV